MLVVFWLSGLNLASVPRDHLVDQAEPPLGHVRRSAPRDQRQAMMEGPVYGHHAISKQPPSLALKTHQDWRTWRKPLTDNRIRLRGLNPVDFGAHALQG